MFPKTGNFFPGREGTKDYAAAVGSALRAELGNSHQATKTVMKWTGASERTVKNWFAGRKGPSGHHLVQLIHYSDGVLDALLMLSGRKQVLAGVFVSQARKAMARFIDQIDHCLAGDEKRQRIA